MHDCDFYKEFNKKPQIDVTVGDLRKKSEKLLTLWQSHEDFENLWHEVDPEFKDKVLTMILRCVPMSSQQHQEAGQSRDEAGATAAEEATPETPEEGGDTTSASDCATQFFRFSALTAT